MRQSAQLPPNCEFNVQTEPPDRRLVANSVIFWRGTSRQTTIHVTDKGRLSIVTSHCEHVASHNHVNSTELVFGLCLDEKPPTTFDTK